MGMSTESSDGGYREEGLKFVIFLWGYEGTITGNEYRRMMREYRGVREYLFFGMRWGQGDRRRGDLFRVAL